MWSKGWSRTLPDDGLWYMPDRDDPNIADGGKEDRFGRGYDDEGLKAAPGLKEARLDGEGSVNW